MEGIFNEVMSLKDAPGVRSFALESDSCKALQWFLRWRTTPGYQSGRGRNELRFVNEDGN